MNEEIKAYMTRLKVLRDGAKEEYLMSGSKDALGRYRAFAESEELARRMLCAKK